jgi:dihydropteroate synthase
MHDRRRFTVPTAAGKSLSLGARTLVMGIINVTPDSFSDGGELFETTRAVEAGVRMVADGADLLDIGGESTRPGARPLDADEERRRVVPVVAALARRVDVPISVDTYKASVADAALAEGAALVNDISGLRYEPELAGVVARHRAAIILMHTRGRSREMYEQATYHDVIDEVRDELRESMAFAVGAGVDRERILVDPGLGFAKHTRHSYEALARLHEFGELGRPIVAGPSRKGFLWHPFGQELLALDRDWATTAAVTAAVLEGAHVVRVHAVREMAHVVRIADEIQKYHRADSRAGHLPSSLVHR